MLKITGVLIITISATIAGYECAGSLKKRVLALEAIIRMLDSLKDKITYFNISLNDFLNEYSEPFLDSSGFLEKARERGITNALFSLSDKLCLTDGDIKLLTKFTQEPAAFTGRLEAQRIEYYIKEIQKNLDKAKSSLPLKTKLFCSLGLLSGILTAVLII